MTRMSLEEHFAAKRRFGGAVITVVILAAVFIGFAMHISDAHPLETALVVGVTIIISPLVLMVVAVGVAMLPPQWQKPASAPRHELTEWRLQELERNVTQINRMTQDTHRLLTNFETHRERSRT